MNTVIANYLRLELIKNPAKKQVLESTIQNFTKLVEQTLNKPP